MIDETKYKKPAFEQESRLKPYHILAFLSTVFACLVGIMAIYPKDGIQITEGFTLYFPTLNSFLGEDEEKAPEIETILADLAEPDTVKPKTVKDSVRKSIKTIQYPGGDKTILYKAFEALERSSQQSGTVRILHYGDSQIEGDRMTSLFRARIQEKFGGSGPGMVAAKPLVNSFSVRQEYSESMNRYTMYGRRDTSVKHRRYGAMAIFSRFAPVIPDSVLGKEQYTGWVSLSRAGGAYNKSKTYNTLRMFYGHNRRPFNVKLFVDDVPYAEDSFPTANRFRAHRWTFDKTPKKVMLIMSGDDSPNIYGLSLESQSGIAVDNISMRGSAGTLFGGIDYGSFKPMLDTLNVKLILMQYGGNAVPYMKSDKAVERYGKDFKRQIAFIKKQVPDAGIIVIGPSDMSKKVKGKLQTYPRLEAVRDALKKAAFESGAAFFDIFEVMGGRNSMIQWVEAKPALAGKDYVHFTPKGAKLIAEKFLKSFMDDYEAYRQGRTQ